MAVLVFPLRSNQWYTDMASNNGTFLDCEVNRPPSSRYFLFEGMMWQNAGRSGIDQWSPGKGVSVL